MPKERILVVDDEYLIRWSLQQELAKEGYEVTTAEDGESALRLVREAPPDLMLLDIQLPGIGGIEVLEKVKAAEPEVVVDAASLPSATGVNPQITIVANALRMAAAISTSNRS